MKRFLLALAAVWALPVLAHAHHRLARLYLGIGTLEYRIRAKWALEKALNLESKKQNHHC